ncbi:MAG: alanine racemase, partial [Candidatus Eremiobacteraeota bacterium]|nr:alanine racemase [Candidatus Eremiobacteraeota bacterium]
MQPQIALDPTIVAQNFKAWHAFAGVPVRPVIKARGYGWGFEPLIHALDALCDCYCVGDLDELFEVRRYSSHPLLVLTSIPAQRMDAALDAGGIPTITSRDELDAVIRWARQTGVKPKIRVGVLPAVGWSGLSLREIDELAPHLAASQLDIEVWSHVTDAAGAATLQGHIAQAVQTIRTLGGHVTGSDLAST